MGLAMIVFVAFSWYAISQVNSVASSTRNLYDHPLQVSTASIQASEGVVKMHRGMKDYVLADDDIARARSLRLVDELEAEVIDYLDVVRDNILGEEGVLLEDRTRTAFLRWKPIRAKVLAKIREGEVDEAKEITRGEGATHVKDLERKLGALKTYALNKADNFMVMAEDTRSDAQTYMILAVVFVAIFLVIIVAALASSIVSPISMIQAQIRALGRGEHPESAQIAGDDEIADMNKSIASMVKGLKNTAKFATEIGNGELDSEFEALGDSDVLGNALLEMRKKLKEVASNEEQRNWKTHGLAEFGEILRSYQDDIKTFSSELVKALVKYLGANQGAIFIVNELENEETLLEMEACYAWDREKHLQRQAKPGQGLVGQCYLEQATLFMTDLPDQFLAVTSGTGKANPRSIVLVPLLTGGEVFGVIELASFDVFQEHEIDFLESLGESIASTIQTAKQNSQTKALLDESNEAVQRIAAQEEELRQNAEELQAIQEEMTRAAQSQESKIEQLEDELRVAKSGGEE